MIKLLKTMVHVESRSRYCSALNTSPTPASPACVAIRICSMYFVFGGAAWGQWLLAICLDAKTVRLR